MCHAHVCGIDFGPPRFDFTPGRSPRLCKFNLWADWRNPRFQLCTVSPLRRICMCSFSMFWIWDSTLGPTLRPSSSARRFPIWPNSTIEAGRSSHRASDELPRERFVVAFNLDITSLVRPFDNRHSAEGLQSDHFSHVNFKSSEDRAIPTRDSPDL